MLLRVSFYLTLVILTVFGCVSKNLSNNDKISDSSTFNNQPRVGSVDDLRKLAIENEKAPLLRPIPQDFIVSEVMVNDSNTVVFNSKCVVFSNYSDAELKQIEKSRTEDQWEGFYDDLAYYSNDASLFLHEKTIVERVSDKSYIKFEFDNGQSIIIDRAKSVETIFFFNPEKEVKQCDFHSFDKAKYLGY